MDLDKQSAIYVRSVTIFVAITIIISMVFWYLHVNPLNSLVLK